MTGLKYERLGVRGTLSLVDGALRLLGGANATGAIAAAVTYQAFRENADVQASVKIAAILFLFGVFFFALSYMAWFVANLDLDHSFVSTDGDDAPNELFNKSPLSPEKHRKSGRRAFAMSMVGGFISVILFLFGLAKAMILAIQL